MSDLFHPKTYHQSQTKFIDTVIPDLKEDGITLNNFEVFDDLLTILEASFRAQDSFTASDGKQHSLLPIPSKEALHLVFTLASRASRSNWTATQSFTKNGVGETLEHIRKSNSFNHACLHKSPLNGRSIAVLQNYVNLARNTQSKSPLYELLVSCVSDFIAKPNLKKNTAFFKVDTPIETEQDAKLEKPEPKRRRVVLDKSGREKEDKMIAISDSDSDGTADVTTSIVESQQDAQQGSQETSKDSELPMLAKITARPTETWNGLRVYDEPLLKDKIGGASRFNLWELINWVFYCSGLSSLCYNGERTACHSIYEAQSQNLGIIFDVIEMNLVVELQQLFSSGDPYLWLYSAPASKKRLACLRVEDSNSMLLSRLTKVLGHSRLRWYDRIVEFTLNGLAPETAPFPEACYPHEMTLVRKEANRKQKRPTSNGRGGQNVEHVEQSDDNVDSMNLRFKICNVVFYWSLAFDDMMETNKFLLGRRSNAEQLKPSIFVKELCKKLEDVDHRYLVEFYLSAANPSQQIPARYRNMFLVRLSSGLLRRITSSLSEDFELKTHFDDDTYQIDNLDLILKWINDPSVYSSVTENELFGSFDEFYQTWMKLNFILEWLLMWVFQDLQAAGNDICTDQLVIDELADGDAVRDEKYFGHIKHCQKPVEETGLKFQVSKEMADIYEARFRNHDDYVSIGDYM
ncbi:uncharacterized protein LODBEIA_P34840 [Lodderomyces beijingensis]|uniref:Uncharacterized protein n=1 Tax=Lodderomyces beijingensis TaxID=1775926 RepID=A0ABP0ZPX8_9ASCO